VTGSAVQIIQLDGRCPTTRVGQRDAAIASMRGCGGRLEICERQPWPSLEVLIRVAG
jgi:hypothetical protein